MIKNGITWGVEHIKWIIIQSITWLIYHFSLSIKLQNIFLFPISFYPAIKNYKKWNTYLKYKKIIGNTECSIKFIINIYTRKTTNSFLSRVFYKYPNCFSKYVDVEGGEHVLALQHKGKGVLVIGNHGGPFMLQTFLFTNIFNIPLSSYSNPLLKTRSSQDDEINKLIQKFPVYFVGEEKKLLNALLSGEWINMLLDVTVNSHQTPNCQFANRNIQLSQFPFRIALKYNIPILYLEVKRGKKIHITLRPINNFSHANEGLKTYVQFLESTIFSDNYSNTLMPFVLENSK